jgi:hypothetical protein
MIENKNQPAFPISEEATDRIIDEVRIFTGLTKREYFAGLAMQAFVSNPSFYQGYSSDATMAQQAVNLADALLLELSKPQP